MGANIETTIVRAVGFDESMLRGACLQWETSVEDRLELFSDLQEKIKSEWAAEELHADRHAADALTLRELEVTGGILTLFLPTGQKKHDRHFKVCTTAGTISWDKKSLTKASQDASSISTRKISGNTAVNPRKTAKVVGVINDTTVQNGASLTQSQAHAAVVEVMHSTFEFTPL